MVETVVILVELVVMVIQKIVHMVGQEEGPVVVLVTLAELPNSTLTVVKQEMAVLYG